MARKKIEITINDRGNDLRFEITEMPATQLESWMMRALLLLTSSKVEVPSGVDLKKAGEHLATQGLSALGGIDYDKAKPLLDELLTCCKRVVEGVKSQCTPGNIDDFVEDVVTLLALRMEVLKLNLGFFAGGPGSALASLAKASSNAH